MNTCSFSRLFLITKNKKLYTLLQHMCLQFVVTSVLTKLLLVRYISINAAALRQYTIAVILALFLDQQIYVPAKLWIPLRVV